MVYSTYHSQNVATLERFKSLESQKKNPKMGILRNKILVIYTQKSDGFLDAIRNLFKDLLNVLSRISGRLTIDPKRVKVFKEQVANDQAKIDSKDQEVAQLKQMIEDLNSKISQPVAAPVVAAPAVVPNQDQTLAAGIAELKQAIQQLSGKEVKDNKAELEALQASLTALASKIESAPAPVQNSNAESLQELKTLVQDLSAKVGQKDSAAASTATFDLTQSFEELKKLVQDLSSKVNQKDSSELDSLKTLMQQIEESLKASKTDQESLILLKEISGDLKIKATAATATMGAAETASLETFLKDLQTRVQELISRIDQSSTAKFDSFKTTIDGFIENSKKQPPVSEAISSLKKDLEQLKKDLEDTNKNNTDTIKKYIKTKIDPISKSISGKDGVTESLLKLVELVTDIDKNLGESKTNEGDIVPVAARFDETRAIINECFEKLTEQSDKNNDALSQRLGLLEDTVSKILSVVETLTKENGDSREKLEVELQKQLTIRDQELTKLRDVREAIAQIDSHLKAPKTPKKSESAAIDPETMASTLLEKLEPRLSEIARNSNLDLKAFLPQIKAYLIETKTPTKAAATATVVQPIDTEVMASQLLEKLENKLKEIVKEIGVKAHEAGIAAIQVGQATGIPVPPPPPPVLAPKPVVTSRQVVPSTPKANNAAPKEDKPSVSNDELFAAIRKSSHRRANSVSSGSPTKDAARTGNSLIDKPISTLTGTPSKPISAGNGNETPGVSTPSFYALRHPAAGSAKAGATKRVLTMLNQEVSAVGTPTKPSKPADTVSTESTGN